MACKYLDESWSPKFIVITAVKRHHTRFFQLKSPDNVPPGTVIDNEVCHPRHNDFYKCAHAAPIGTLRPVHYHVLLDEIGFPVYELQELVHSLSYVYQRGHSAISDVAPVRYARLLAAQMLEVISSDEMPKASRDGGSASSGWSPLQGLPKLHGNVCNSMFFC
ncbi:Argonaute family protein [Quillaja saponaria]|uniref:Argonaute family protein n=1 Tax=Quillaja saponaria TaxID=32244 RepID=A0AAD7VI00_QUISA|nr:Argonaute family protein [Quillaja saponaria]